MLFSFLYLLLAFGHVPKSKNVLLTKIPFMFKKTINLCLILFLFSYAKSQNTNNICADCGDFDLLKITFDENVNAITSKADPFKTVFVNKTCEEKEAKQLFEDDDTCGFKYNIFKKKTEKPYLSVEGNFKFDVLHLLTNAKNELAAYNASAEFKGDEKKFQLLVNIITEKFKTNPVCKTLFLDEALVYQWNTASYFCQLTRSKNKQKQETKSNGKNKIDQYYYITLSVYQNNRLDPKIKEIIRRNENFVIYKEKDFVK